MRETKGAIPHDKRAKIREIRSDGREFLAAAIVTSSQDKQGPFKKEEVG